MPILVRGCSAARCAHKKWPRLPVFSTTEFPRVTAGLRKLEIPPTIFAAPRNAKVATRSRAQKFHHAHTQKTLETPAGLSGLDAPSLGFRPELCSCLRGTFLQKENAITAAGYVRNMVLAAANTLRPGAPSTRAHMRASMCVFSCAASFTCDARLRHQIATKQNTNKIHR